MTSIGIFSNFQLLKMHEQIELMYEHPMEVSRDIGKLRTDVYLIHWNFEKFLITKDTQRQNDYLKAVYLKDQDAIRQLDILENKFLGPKQQIESLRIDFYTCRKNREEVIHLIQVGQFELATNLNMHSTDEVDSDHIKLLEKKIAIIDQFASNKAQGIEKRSFHLFIQMAKSLGVLILIAVLVVIIFYFVIRVGVLNPIMEFTKLTNRFKDGDLGVRFNFMNKNELGLLASSFNQLVSQVQLNVELNKKNNELAQTMLMEGESSVIFQTMLKNLCQHTNSQMAAFYLKSENNKQFYHFQSIGLSDKAKQSFDSANYEGEFGLSLSTKEIQHIKNLNPNHIFEFSMVSGKMMPTEIINIPIVEHNQVLAIISLASVNAYSTKAIEFVYFTQKILTSSISNILNTNNLKELSTQLEKKNHDLIIQKTEIASQKDELLVQNNELVFQKRQLEDMNKMKTIFLSNMSHELRTPLNSVIALSGVLERKLQNAISEEEFSYLSVIQRNGKHLLNLINDILDLARIESGREELEIQVFDICLLVTEITDLIKPQAQIKDLELEQIPCNTLIEIESDAAKCRHIFTNLIGNAVKFTEHGKVTVAIQANSQEIIISVKDTGIGIESNQFENIFDEFRQADGSNSKKFGGTGLGLSIAKKYVEMLHGYIQVQSQLNYGSEFIVHLPVTMKMEMSHLPTLLDSEKEFATAPRMLSSAHKIHILLVDDSEPAIIQLSDVLSEQGYQIHVARNGNEAIEQIGKHIPEAVILDLMMPEIDGFEVLARIRENEDTMNVKVLILTAKHISKEELKFLKRSGVHQLIQKGDINRKDLLAAVSSMFDIIKEPISKTEIIFPNYDENIEILVVEDNPDNMLTIKALLKDRFKVLKALNGFDAIRMAKLHKPRLILMDIEMPILNGMEAFKAIRSNPELQDIPIVAVSASVMNDEIIKTTELGFEAFLSKPIDIDKLYQTINKLVYGNR
jgi:signal transduction histidine kinase/response regulator RpfG family c-di-GMP phosphodiesterase/HAMP domain-containing protein